MLTALALVACLARCRYTVRDIGFVDLVGAEYSLTGGALDPEQRVLCASLAPGANVLPKSGDSPAWSLRREGLDPLQLAAESSVREAWQAAVHSPLRDRLLAQALDSFATIVHVRGDDAAEDARTSEVVRAALDRLEALEPTLPRPIELPLVELELKRDARETERVLLWSLGLDAAESRTALVVLYGRGKLAGPVLIGSEITELELLTQLALVGRSCECDTPRDWFHEPRIPMAWTQEQRESAAGKLGFDPQSPRVKAEVARILDRGPLASPSAASTSVESLLLGYREFEVGADASTGSEGDVSHEPAASPPGHVLAAAGGDDWGFQEDEKPPKSDGSSLTAPQEPIENQTLYGKDSGRSILLRRAPLILAGVVLGSFLTWIVAQALRKRDR